MIKWLFPILGVIFVFASFSFLPPGVWIVMVFLLLVAGGVAERN